MTFQRVSRARASNCSQVYFVPCEGVNEKKCFRYVRVLFARRVGRAEITLHGIKASPSPRKHPGATFHPSVSESIPRRRLSTGR